MTDLDELRKMLEALLRSERLVEWIGGWVAGRTSQDDPFIILYPAADHLKEKACRVYGHHFDRLPDFIDTSRVPPDTDANPSKGQAQRAGIYHECPRFKIVMHLGRETQLGREKRFSDVLVVPRTGRRQTQPADDREPLQPGPPPQEAQGQAQRLAQTDPRQAALVADSLTEFANAAAEFLGAAPRQIVQLLVATFEGNDRHWPYDPQHNNRYLNAVVDSMADAE